MLDRIRACLSALPPAEQRVARLVLEDPREFAVLPVGELAARAQVSKPTVVRFCRSVGYDGLADFKRKLAGSVNEGVPFVHRAVDEIRFGHFNATDARGFVSAFAIDLLLTPPCPTTLPPRVDVASWGGPGAAGRPGFRTRGAAAFRIPVQRRPRSPGDLAQVLVTQAIYS